MKFYLSSPATDSFADGALVVKINNISGKKGYRKEDHNLIETPNDAHIRQLNDLASKPPFCFIYRVKKFDTL